MTNIVATTVGSGTLPQTRAILPASQRGNQPLGAGIRTGIQVVVANPEDLNSVDIVATSGAVVSTIATQLLGPHLNPLPRTRQVTIQNLGDSTVYIGFSSSIVAASGVGPTAGFALEPDAASSQVVLPILHNVEIWGIAAAGSVPQDVRLLIL